MLRAPASDLTDKQKDVYQYIFEWIEENQRPPTIYQIASRFGVTPTAIVGRINGLARKGWLSYSRDQDGVTRIKVSGHRCQLIPVCDDGALPQAKNDLPKESS